MVFGGHHDIFCSDFSEEVGPSIRIPVLSFKLWNDVFVAELRRNSAPARLNVWSIMFGVRIDQFWHVFGIAAPALAVTYHTVRAPMNKDTNLAVIEPSRHWHFLE